jgi:phytoene dehydrogenase-like protein
MNLFVLVNAPALGPRVRWEREAGPYRDLVIAKLERMGLSDLGRQIAYEQIWSPADIAARYNAAGGAIYGLASNNPFAAFLRPPLRARGIGGLYFVGGGTHPGRHPARPALRARRSRARGPRLRINSLHSRLLQPIRIMAKSRHVSHMKR